MATDPPSQRSYRAACPNCGAPIEFRSAASAFAVCTFCNSTVVREGEALRRIGQSAELFDDHSPLQLGAAGRYQGAAFTLVGRLQYQTEDGLWNEWHALFDGAGSAPKSGWLSEDNGRYVIAFDAPLEGLPPDASALRVGAQVVLGGQAWSVASVVQATLRAALGELPQAPPLGRGFTVSDLRSARGEVGTLDYSDAAAPRWSVGRSVALAELAMTGLADAAAEKTLGARGVPCPNCGAPLAIKLATTQSIVCGQCQAVVDVSQGVGGDLKHYVQGNGMAPQIPLGSTGTLALGGTAAAPWQVVGYVERCEVAGPGRDDDGDADGGDDAQSFWREYLLYHRTQGFAFLVDADDGWSWSVPITGVPERFGDSVKHQGTLYRKLYDYTGQVTYVLGEFYWRLTRDQRTRNTDYQGTGGGAATQRLYREQTVGAAPARGAGVGSSAAAAAAPADEVVWSAGETITADAVMQAFRLAPEQRAGLQRDAAPTSLGGASLLAKFFLWGFVIVLALMLWRCASSGDGTARCNGARSTYGEASTEYRNCLAASRSGSGGYRTGGGSFGGFSSGGGHK